MTVSLGHLTRRHFGQLAFGLAASAALPKLSFAQVADVGSAGRRHGLSAFGPLQHEEGFSHFPYVNPEAPKGGSITLQLAARAYNQSFNTFDTLNMYVLRGNGPAGIDMTFATLMASNPDEIGSAYGYAAEWVEVSPDRLTLRFGLRPEASFHDGTPIAAADVVFSILTLREHGHENLASDLRGVEAAEAEDERTVRVRLAPGTGRNLPLVVAAGVPIFSSAWWEGRDFGAGLSEAALGSGLYRVAGFSFGSHIDFERVDGHWAADLPAFKGTGNFDRIRYEYYRDRNAAFQSFTAGRTTFREEFTSRVWATDYNFPAVADGRVTRFELPDQSPSGGQGWFLNTRRAKFQDRRVRQGIGMLFDFEWANANLMYGSYVRSASFYEKTASKAEGVPGAAELAILEPLRGRIPDEVFGEVPLPPVHDGSGCDRAMVRRALETFQSAGCRVEGGRMLLPDGSPLTIEFLDDDATFEAHHNAFIANLRLVGITATYRVVDASQYTDRVRGYDFDVTTARFNMPLYPNDFIRQFFGSAAAQRPGSYNYAGIANPAVDEILAKIVAAETPDAFEAANRALDRVLRTEHYVVPHWYKPVHWLAAWDMYGRPETKPLYSSGVLSTWWHDPDKARAIGRG